MQNNNGQPSCSAGKSNYVYINPKFKKFSRICDSSRNNGSEIRVLPHLNAAFYNLNTFHRENDKYSTNFYDNPRNENTFSVKSKIHVNPKMLVAFNSSTKPSDIPTVEPHVQSKNKFTKINPKKVNDSDVSCKLTNPIRSLPVRPKKPSHKLVNTNNVDPYSTSNFRINREDKKIQLKRPTLLTDSLHRVLISKKKLDGTLMKTSLKKVNLKLSKLRLISKMESNSKVIFIGSEKFIVCEDKLKKINSKIRNTNNKIIRRIAVQGRMFVRKSDNLFILENKIKTPQKILTTPKSLGKVNNVHPVKVTSKKLKKVNFTCPIFRRLGVCGRYNEDRCPLIHDPKNISICRKFLRGECQIDGCHLSHNVTAEKMPTCRYFLEGCCTKVNCPYLHVKINDSADICIAFLQGFCKAAKNCKNLHLYICPAFYKSGICNHSKCIYPHKKISYKKPSLPTNIVKNCHIQTHSSNSFVKTNGDEIVSRYYRDDGIEDNDTPDMVDKKILPVAFADRPKIGSLPSFIAL